MDKFIGFILAIACVYGAYRLYHSKLKAWPKWSLMALTSLLAFGFLVTPYTQSDTSEANEPSTHHTVKAQPVKHHHHKNDSAKDRQRAASSKAASKASSESASSRDAESSSISESIAESQSAADSSSREAESKASSENAAASSQAASQAKAAAQASQQQQAASTVDSTQGPVIGNSRTHVYHTPDQATYHLSSANAVTFNSEQDAINAGYRKSLR